MANQQKLNRNYNLFIQANDGGILNIEPPFTLEMDITRNILSSANVASIRIYNLSEVNRNQIRKDQFTFDNRRTVTLQAGYGTNLPVVLNGQISQAWSVREGNNFITQIECYDAGFAFANAVTSQQFPEGTAYASIIGSFMESLRSFDVSAGAIGSYPGQLTRGNSYSGSTTSILSEITGRGFFIDNGKAHCLNDKECLATPVIQTIDSAAGLLGTPIRENKFINFDMIFEPSVSIGQVINLKSVTQQDFNGPYKILGIKHRGMISPAVCGELITSLHLLGGTFTPVAEAS